MNEILAQVARVIAAARQAIAAPTIPRTVVAAELWKLRAELAELDRLLEPRNTKGAAQ